MEVAGPLGTPLGLAQRKTKATLCVKAQHEGALPPPCIVRKDPRVCKACTALIWPRGVSWRLKPIPYKPEMGNTESFLCSEAPQGLAWIHTYI